MWQVHSDALTKQRLMEHDGFICSHFLQRPNFSRLVGVDIMVTHFLLESLQSNLHWAIVVLQRFQTTLSWTCQNLYLGLRLDTLQRSWKATILSSSSAAGKGLDSATTAPSPCTDCMSAAMAEEISSKVSKTSSSWDLSCFPSKNKHVLIMKQATKWQCKGIRGQIVAISQLESFSQHVLSNPGFGRQCFAFQPVKICLCDQLANAILLMQLPCSHVASSQGASQHGVGCWAILEVIVWQQACEVLSQNEGGPKLSALTKCLFEDMFFTTTKPLKKKDK